MTSLILQRLYPDYVIRIGRRYRAVIKNVANCVHRIRSTSAQLIDARRPRFLGIDPPGWPPFDPRLDLWSGNTRKMPLMHSRCVLNGWGDIEMRRRVRLYWNGFECLGKGWSGPNCSVDVNMKYCIKRSTFTYKYYLLLIPSGALGPASMHYNAFLLCLVY